MQRQKKKRKKNDTVVKYNPRYTEARLLYCHGQKDNGSNFSLAEVALQFNIPERNLYHISTNEKWVDLRNKALANVNMQVEKILERKRALRNSEIVENLKEIVDAGFKGVIKTYKEDKDGKTEKVMTPNELDKMVRLERLFNGNGIDVSNEVIVDLQKDVSEFTMEELAEVKRNLDREIEKSNAIDVSSYEE